jgi:hypothetical protein
VTHPLPPGYAEGRNLSTEFASFSSRRKRLSGYAMLRVSLSLGTRIAYVENSDPLEPAFVLLEDTVH